MTKYTINFESDDERLFWSSIFVALSSRWFKDFAKIISCQIAVTDRIIEISRGFVIAYSEYIGFSVPKIPDINFTAFTWDENMTFKEAYEKIWTTAFSQLEEEKCALEIYNWGRSQLELENRLKSSFGFLSGVTGFMIYWSHDPEQDQFGHLELPNNLVQEIQFIALRHCITYLRSKEYAHVAKNNYNYTYNNNLWDKFIFNEHKIGSWWVNLVERNLKISMWQKIFDLLSEQQLHILDEWCSQGIETRFGRKHEYSLIELLEAIKS